jgi:hypothetical protein
MTTDERCIKSIPGILSTTVAAFINLAGGICEATSGKEYESHDRALKRISHELTAQPDA